MTAKRKKNYEGEWCRKTVQFHVIPGLVSCHDCVLEMADNDPKVSAFVVVLD